MGTMLHAAGNSLDRALPELNLSNSELVSTVHESYVAAGADLLLTNTFGANRLRLAELGGSATVRDVNMAGVRLARQARRGARRTVFVGGSVSPAAKAGQGAAYSPDERIDVIREQVTALIDGGVDLLVLETFGGLGELLEAVAIAVETDVPVIAQATFTAEGRTLDGETPEEVAKALARTEVAAIGANCTVGPQHMLGIVKRLRGTLPVSAQPNAGIPRRIGRRFEYGVDGEYFARYARAHAESGASIVGGCCGTTPGHIREVVARLADLRPPEQRRKVSKHKRSSEPARGKLAQRLRDKEFVVAAQYSRPGDHQGVDLVFGKDIATMTAWDKTITTLQDELHGAHAFGLRTVVCETGSPPPLGDYPDADGILEVDSIGLIELLAAFNAGRDRTGHTLVTRTAFHIGARFNPGAADLDAELVRTKAKIAAGAQFLVTTPVYDLESFAWMLTELSEEDIPILMSVHPLSGYAEAEYLAHEVPDVRVPPDTLEALQAGERTGYEVAGELLAAARKLADGVVLHIRDSSEITKLLG
ncbi:bifunctional homocysteine S-methyltransferase/methylenetetrahydrofolate reductase [Amycolatopsis acidicola]|uniref:Bifunctional homocysteine S-methyltransferase/methylenetetrahydrofolate reductase n=2 Tax=Amycolatopsis acidicola TaxID=2596893 RepID=A0A5N0V7H3_9PSEU|nr:bifunctional homocysteine S-methyltransferase/methylenetetrahydrofolate reductase [Amycolatopsis acidicola]